MVIPSGMIPRDRTARSHLSYYNSYSIVCQVKLVWQCFEKHYFDYVYTIGNNSDLYYRKLCVRMYSMAKNVVYTYINENNTENKHEE